MNKVGLHLQQKHDLAMTTELREAIELLQLSALDVHDLVNRELSDNPCLEQESAGDDWMDVSSSGADEGDWDNTLDNISDAGADGPVAMGGNGMAVADDDSTGWEATASKAATLHDHVLQQYDQIVHEPRLRVVGHYLIDALDDAGYLRMDLAEAAQRLGVKPETVDDARAILQSLEPLGIGSRDLAECLRLQLHAADNLTVAADVCLSHLDKVAAGDLAGLAKLARCEVQAVREALLDIRSCNPKPGLSYGWARVETVVPDVLVEADGAGGWTVELNGLAFPKLLANAPQRVPAGGGKAGEQARHYLQERFGRAKWLVNALEQRARTIVKVAREIVATQAGFFDAGAEFMVPLTLKQVADKVGVHESTVSRVTTGKYMQTPRGVFEFKSFFASGVGSTGGTVAVASTSVQAMIQRFVKEENPQKPLSDEKLVSLLKKEGVDVARRTVAKYRGILNIPGTAERKVR